MSIRSEWAVFKDYQPSENSQMVRKFVVKFRHPRYMLYWNWYGNRWGTYCAFRGEYSKTDRMWLIDIGAVSIGWMDVDKRSLQ